MPVHDYSQARHSAIDDRRLNDYIRFCKVSKTSLPDLIGFDNAWNRQQERILKLEKDNAKLRSQCVAPEGPPEPPEPTERVYAYPDVSIKEMERVMVISALQRYSGNKTHTAIALGMTVKTLYNKISVYGITQNMFVEKEKHE